MGEAKRHCIRDKLYTNSSISKYIKFHFVLARFEQIAINVCFSMCPHNLIELPVFEILRFYCIMCIHELAWASFLFLPTADRCAVHRYTH